MKTRIAIVAITLGAALAAPVLAQRNNSGGTLTADQAQRMLFMREEEKLARDVYRFLDEKWNVQVFRNIAQSEETHFQQVGRLLERYGLEDPAADRGPGEYAAPELTQLYLELTAMGATSLKDALEVGVLIEETDIRDLEQALVEATQRDIKRVYTNLLAASYNHLETFETSIEVLIAPLR